MLSEAGRGAIRSSRELAGNLGNQVLRGSREAGQKRKGTYCKQDEVLLVVLAHAVIDPGTVVVHLPNAPLTHTETAPERSVRRALAGAPGTQTWPPAGCGLQGLQVSHPPRPRLTQWMELTWCGCSFDATLS